VVAAPLFSASAVAWRSIDTKYSAAA